MAKYMKFHTEINDKTVFDFINLMDLHLENSDEPIELSWDSPGGSASELHTLLRYVNDYPLEITINVTGQCASCGLLFLFLVNRRVQVMPTAYAMAHFVSTVLFSRELRDEKSCSYVRYEQALDLDIAYCDIYRKMGMPEEDINMLESGQDVNFGAKKLANYLTVYKNKIELDSIDKTIKEVKQEIKDLYKDKSEVKKIIKEALKRLEA